VDKILGSNDNCGMSVVFHLPLYKIKYYYGIEL
jgi:hypothetical protein